MCCWNVWASWVSKSCMLFRWSHHKSAETTDLAIGMFRSEMPWAGLCENVGPFSLIVGLETQSPLRYFKSHIESIVLPNGGRYIVKAFKLNLSEWISDADRPRLPHQAVVALGVTHAPRLLVHMNAKWRTDICILFILNHLPSSPD